MGTGWRTGLRGLESFEAAQERPRGLSEADFAVKNCWLAASDIALQCAPVLLTGEKHEALKGYESVLVLGHADGATSGS